MKRFLLFLSFMMLWGISNAQRLKQFSDNRAAFVDELETLMTASKRKVMIETFEQFETVFNSGLFNEEEVKHATDWVRQALQGMSLPQRRTMESGDEYSNPPGEAKA